MSGTNKLVIGVFMAAPIGSLIFLALTSGIRLTSTWVFSKATHRPFQALDRPVGPPPGVKR